MAKCPNCSTPLEPKEGIRKVSAQIGNPEIAIVETHNPQFCSNCNEYYLSTEDMASAVIQIKSALKDKKTIEKGVYS